MTHPVQRLAASLLLPTLAALAGAQPPDPPTIDRPILVIDAGGHVVGRYLDGPAVLLRTPNGWTRAPLTSTTFGSNRLTWGTSVFFALGFHSTDCQGDAGIEQVGELLPGTLPSVLVTVAGHPMLYAADSFEQRPAAFRSRSLMQDSATCQSLGVPPGWTAWIVRKPIDLSTMFEPPFTLK